MYPEGVLLSVISFPFIIMNYHDLLFKRFHFINLVFPSYLAGHDINHAAFNQIPDYFSSERDDLRRKIFAHPDAAPVIDDFAWYYKIE